MKINSLVPQIKTDNKIQKVKASSAAEVSSTQTTSADRVQLSSNLVDVQKMKNIIQETPSVRVDRVQALKEQIESGEYQVDPYRVADKMLMNLLSESGIADE